MKEYLRSESAGSISPIKTDVMLLYIDLPFMISFTDNKKGSHPIIAVKTRENLRTNKSVLDDLNLSSFLHSTWMLH